MYKDMCQFAQVRTLHLVDEIDNFLDTYQVPKVKQDQINYLSSSISPEEIQAVVNSLPTTTTKKQNKTTNKQTNKK